MKRLITLLTLIVSLTTFSQTCSNVIKNDKIESYDWLGGWWVGGTSGYFTNANVTPTSSAALYGIGNGTSAYESDWYSLPNVPVNSTSKHIFRFRLASYRFTSTNTTRGVDVGDYITVQLSTDGGVNYVQELRIAGNNNAYWNYNTNGVVSSTANGLLEVFSPSAGGDRTSTNDGFSVIELVIPPGVSNIAIDIFTRANSAGEEWWFDNFELIEVVNTSIQTQVVTNDMVWNGQVSDNYSTPNNWWSYNGTTYTTSTTAPTSSTNVIIPQTQTCVLNQPNTFSNTVNSKNITIENGASLTMGNGVLNVNGNFRNLGSFTSGTGTVKFVGSNPRDSIFGATQSHSFYNLTIQKSGGIEAVLGTHIDVKNNLSINSKNLRLNSQNIDLGTTGQIINEGPGHRAYCDCPVGYIQSTITIGSNTTVNPGNLGLTITTNNNPMGTTIVKRRHLRAGSSGSSELVNGTPGIYRIFDVTPEFNGGTTYPLASGGLDVDLEFQYYIDEVGSEILAQEGEFGLWRSGNDGNSWEPHFGQVDLINKTISLEGWKQFSWVTGGPVENPEALPIELISFQANCSDNGNKITWSTASEHNTSHFVVEKSLDGVYWEKIGQVDAAGNSTQVLNYELRDFEKSNNVIYYRLTQYDNDGKYETFNPVSLNCDINENLISYPNPSEDRFYISFYTETMKGLCNLKIIDVRGVEVLSKEVNVNSGSNVFNVEDLNLSSGVYYIQFVNGSTISNTIKHKVK